MGQLFAKAYGGTGWDVGRAIVQTPDGGFAISGEAESFGLAGDFFLLKLNSDGTVQWVRCYGGASSDPCFSMIKTSDNGFAMTGRTSSFGAGNGDALVLKISSAGALEWARTYGGSAYDFAWCITQTTDGGYALTGTTQSSGAGGYDIFAIKLSSAGAVDWARTFGGTNEEMGYSIIQTSDGGYAISGYTFSFAPGGNTDLIVIKLDASGNTLWARTFGGGGLEDAWGLVEAGDGGIVVGGETGTSAYGAGGIDFMVIKLNSDGSTAWIRTYGGTGSDEARCMKKTADGGFVMAGWTNSYGAGQYDILILKISPAGALEWARTLGGGNYDLGWMAIQTADGGYAATGATTSYGMGNYDYCVLRLDQNGNYPSCVLSCSPSTNSPSPVTSSPAVGATWTPTVLTPTVTTTTPSPTVTTVCATVGSDEADPSDSRPKITCSPVSGGAVFLSPESMDIRIYMADGRLVYSGELVQGENRISLGQGAYLWIAGPNKGKLVVR